MAPRDTRVDLLDKSISSYLSTRSPGLNPRIIEGRDDVHWVAHVFLYIELLNQVVKNILRAAQASN